MTYTRRTKLEDIAYVANNLRPADQAEVKAASGRSPKEVLLQCFFESIPCQTICNDNDEAVAMWGAVPMGDTVGGVWLLGTTGLTAAGTRTRFLREARTYVDQLQKKYPVLANCVDVRNKAHIRWLRWMGFTFIAEHPNYGAEGRAFLEFCRMRP